MGLRQTWRDYRTVAKELSPRTLVPRVVRDVRAGRLTVGEVASATVHTMLDLGGGHGGRSAGHHEDPDVPGGPR